MGSFKVVVLSHRMIAERVLATNDALRIGPTNRIVWVLSISYHITVSIVGFLTLGATIVLPASRFAAAIFGEFLDRYDGGKPGCLVADIRMPGISGLELQKTLRASGIGLPVIFVTAHGEIPWRRRQSGPALSISFPSRLVPNHYWSRRSTSTWSAGSASIKRTKSRNSSAD